ncbi:thiamine-phosphate kinase [Ornithobacterium rhinotracheale]|uniref:Thiamine-monophosphate kinase n=1 Tax=Ornithobacterium rhinotracheale TaxID=28251 RepID=A0A3R5UY80_ORNRH|nr:thiamine-phosphate kinase [Ornithobacterium rhinotracheale]QAR31231.1 thiamine-phosphate kinase [Ornithobacterium rhinotracheale]
MLEDKNIPTTPLSEIGEFGLIDRIKQSVKIKNPSTQKGIADDAAVMDFGNKQVVVSTDMLTEGVHFNLAYTPLKHLGYKAIATNVSDICAMNATPTQVTVSIAVSDRFPVEAIDELYTGILLACEKYKVDLVGGDTTSSRSGLLISVTAIGEAKKEDLVYRDGAKEQDLVVVTGDLGGAYFGLQILERENQVFKVNPQVQPDLTPYDYIIGRQLKPEARVDTIELFKKLDVKPTAMIDISDGLASELLHLSDQSGVGFTIYEEKIPLDQQVISAGEEFDMNASIGALNGGEDYELLFTLPLSEFDKIKANPNFTTIGFANHISEGNHLIGRGNTTKVPLSSQGWDSFKRYKENLEKNKD